MGSAIALTIRSFDLYSTDIVGTCNELHYYEPNDALNNSYYFITRGGYSQQKNGSRVIDCGIIGRQFPMARNRRDKLKKTSRI